MQLTERIELLVNIQLNQTQPNTLCDQNSLYFEQFIVPLEGNHHIQTRPDGF